MSTPELSLCMIVKNEEKTLGNCLKSVASLVDEMIVIDTGSTDSTVQIAEQFGAKVFKEMWQDDFAQARNLALEKATGDWVLVLDADEELSSDGIEEIKPMLKDSRYQSYLVKIVNCSADEKSPVNYLTHQNVRLFRNNPEYTYRGIIHEELNFLSDEPDLEIGDAPFKIFHHGYNDDTEEERATRRKRNMKLLRRALKKEPADPKLHYYMGVEYLGQHKWQRALSSYKLARNIRADSYLQPLIAQDIIVCLVELGQLKEALIAVKRAHKNYPDFLGIYYLQGEIYVKMNQHKRAMDCFRECVNLRDKPAMYCQETGLVNAAVFGIGICGMILSQDQLAIEAFTECMNVDPADAVSFEYLGRILLKRESAAKVGEKLKGLADLSNPDIADARHRLGLKPLI